MNTNNFKEMSLDQQANTYGGSFFKALITALPVIIELGVEVLGAVKSFLSPNGSIKTKTSTASWKTDAKPSHAASSKSSKSHDAPIYYVY